ncbi:MAG: hypothetical protein ABEJ78_08135 [Haloferacaceae archaeon]
MPARTPPVPDGGLVPNRKLGTSLFLVGMAVGLFLDDVLGAESSFQRLAEPMGAVVALGGLLVSWVWRPD